MEFHALPPVLRSELAFSRSPGGKLNGADPKGSSEAIGGCGDTALVIEGGGGGGATATTATAATGTTGAAAGATTTTPEAFCSVGVSVDVVEADLVVMPA